ncbi:MAG: iron ABC transporter permease [Thermoleophilia bacterium]|nr:iron ABC transporter permease [Thermoleophilia bacterium]
MSAPRGERRGCGPRAAPWHWALAALPLAFLAVFLAWPLVAIGERALRDAGSGHTFPFDVLVASSTLHVVWFTLWQAAVSTLLTLTAALPATWALSRFAFPGRRLAHALVIVPFALPTVVAATAFLVLLPERLDQSIPAILAAHVWFNVAVVIQVVGGAWERLDATPREAAATLGAGPVRNFLLVTAPLLRAPIAAAGAIVFVFCFTSFGAVVILGGPRYRTLEAAIWDEAVRAFDLRTAATLALIQLVAVAVLLAASIALERRTQGAIPAAARPLPRPRAGRERIVVVLALGSTLLLLATPLAVLVERSLRVADGHGFGHWASLFAESPALLVEPWRAAWNSLAYAFVATAIALCVGGAMAVLGARRGSAFDLAAMLPLGAPAAMLGLGMLIAFAGPPLDLRGSWVIVPLAQALVAAPFVVRAVGPALRGVDGRLRDAAAVLGAPPARVWRELDLPLVLRALGIGAGLAFAVCLGEFGATAFVAASDTPTLTTAIFRFLGRPGAENAGTAAALAVTLMTITGAAAAVTGRAGRHA